MIWTYTSETTAFIENKSINEPSDKSVYNANIHKMQLQTISYFPKHV